jgi:uncharacterized protein (DUF433 family)
MRGYNIGQMVETHRQYFQTYKLSAAQYGEILVAQAVDGEKKGDAQPCYDVRADAGGVRRLLERANADAHSPVWPREGEVRIQVRSKLTLTPSGTATVVHCRDNDFKEMIHLAVVLVHPDGTIENAWLMTSDTAARLRKKKGATQYIRVSQLKSQPPLDDVVEITSVLTAAADTRFDAGTSTNGATAETEVIRKTPGICGGNARIRDTRIAVWTLWRLKELGRTDAQLLDDYPSLTSGDLLAAWTYAAQHRDELSKAFARQGRAPLRKVTKKV